MNTIIHRAFSSSILNQYQISIFDKWWIVHYDVSQDFPFYQSKHHYGEEAFNTFSDTLQEYQQKPTKKALGKLLHYTLDLSTPVHNKLSYHLGQLAGHVTYESIANRILTPDNIAHSISEGKEQISDSKQILTTIGEIQNIHEKSISELFEIVEIMASPNKPYEEIELKNIVSLLIRSKFNMNIEEEEIKNISQAELMADNIEHIESDLEFLKTASINDIRERLKEIEREKTVPLITPLRKNIHYVKGFSKHLSDCIGRATPIAMAICDMQYSRVEDTPKMIE